MTKPQNPRKRAVRGSPMAFLLALSAKNEPACIEWPFAKDQFGYGKVKLQKRLRRAHRLALSMATGGDRAGLEAAHNCGNASCVNPLHLRWATRLENQADRHIHGTDTRGDRHGMSKLDAQKVLAIADLRKSNTQKQVAEMLGVSRATISDIERGGRWGWLTQNSKQSEGVSS